MLTLTQIPTLTLTQDRTVTLNYPLLGAAIMWADGSGVTPFEKNQWGVHQWDTTSDSSETTYYCLLVAPVQAPEKAARSFGADTKCERATGSPTKVNFWAFFASPSDGSSDDACKIAHGEMDNKKGGIIKDWDNLEVLQDSFDSGGSTELQDFIIGAKQDFIAKMKGAFIDNSQAKYVVLTNSPQEDAKLAQDVGSSYLLYAYLTWIAVLCLCGCGMLRETT